TRAALAVQPALGLGSHLASALISALTGISDNGVSVNAAAIVLQFFGPEAAIPSDVADLCDRVSEIPYSDLPGLIAELSPDPETAEAALRELTAMVQAIAARSPTTSSSDKEEGASEGDGL